MVDIDKIKLKLGISSCLLGNKVRFDSGHKRDQYIMNILSEFVSFVPVCPEIEVGMGVPRESVRLIGQVDSPRMVGNKSGKDWTDRMLAYSANRVKKKNLENLSGFILKKKSPSCGMERVKVYSKPSSVENKGVGLFAVALMRQFPHLPVEEEGRLNDAVLRENFIERIFAYNRLQLMYARPFSRKSMIDFHMAHKYMLLSHSADYYRQLGKLVARIKEFKPSLFKEEYLSLFMRALKFKSTVNKNVNVLQHIAGFLKNKLTKSEKDDIHRAIADYHNSFIPLVVPITLMKHFIFKYEVEYVKNQYYLNPHPKELMLRNHV